MKFYGVYMTALVQWEDFIYVGKKVINGTRGDNESLPYTNLM